MPMCMNDESVTVRPIKNDSRLRLSFGDFVDLLLTAAVWVAIP